MSASVPLVRLENVSKSFGKIHANRNISLSIEAGKIMTLLGENGAGKSTLMGMLAGRLQPDGGRILIDGNPRRFSSPRDAIAAGIGMVYQHFKLVEAMTVAENIFLGQVDGLLVNHDAMVRTVIELARKVRLEIDPTARVADLSMGEKQRVEILKLLFRQSRVLIFDEPTAVLTPQEADQLFDALRQMTAQGKAIVFISHKLDEVMALADDVAVLRQGRVVADLPSSQVDTKEALARLMVGRDVILKVDREPLDTKQSVLHIMDLNDENLKSLDLQVRQGEIVALVGVAGNGQKTLVEIVSGIRTPRSGSVKIMGEDWQRFFARRTWDGNMAYIPEDRMGLATCGNLDLTDNFLLTTRQGFASGPWLQRQKAESKIQDLIATFDIQPPDRKAQARQLSGGNLQKMVIAREFYRRPRLIVAEQPTQGLDIAATEEVWKLLLKARQRAGILLVTGDLAEALSLADRMAVIFEGRIIDTFPVEQRRKVERIGSMMAGLDS